MSEPTVPGGPVGDRTRWEMLLEAVVAMTADLALDVRLERIVAAAATLVDARYAALGVLDLGSEKRLRTFVHHGLGTEVVRSIGELPAGHGLLGLIIDRPEPLRLHDIAPHPASYGFPPGHPPMHSFLGVPVRTRDQVFGNLYLTEKEGDSDFTAEDERIVVALASAAGVAVENALLYEQVRVRERWLAATAEVTNLLLGGRSGQAALQTVADRVRELAEADVVFVMSGSPTEGGSQDLALQVISGPDVDIELLRAFPTRDTPASEVVAAGAARVIGDFGADPRVAAVDVVPGWPRLGPAIIVPLSPSRDISGVLGLAWTHGHSAGFRDLDPDLPARFAEQAALTLQVSQAHEDQQRLTLFQDRDRIGRDLHDVVIQRLFAVGLSLEGASHRAQQPDLRLRLESAVDDLDGTIKDIRQTIFELGAPHGGPDLGEVVSRRVHRAAEALTFQPTLSVAGPVSSAVVGDAAADLLAVLTESLSNAARHARASWLHVRLDAGEDVVLEVTDDGRGLPEGVVESGLRNMRERASRHGGTCVVAARSEGGTRVTWSIPAAAASQER